MLSERITTRENAENTIPMSAVAYTDFPAVEEEKPARRLDGRQRSDHFTATFGCLAMMQMGREG